MATLQASFCYTQSLENLRPLCADPTFARFFIEFDGLNILLDLLRKEKW